MDQYQNYLTRYAELVVQVGLGLKAGQRLLIEAPTDTAPLIRLVAEHAFKAGARRVDVMWVDDPLRLIRFQHAPKDTFDEYPEWYQQGMTTAAERGDALLFVYSHDPDLFRDVDPGDVIRERNARSRALLKAHEVTGRDLTNWLVIATPVPGWAERVYPNLPPSEALARFWDDVFEVMRVKTPNPVAAWQKHLAELRKRSSYLNAKSYDALKYRGPGTDLTVGLPAGHLWRGGEGETPSGIHYVANMPTEEVYTLPHRGRAEGVVTASRPLSLRGYLVNGFSVRFKDGRVVQVKADKGEEAFRKMIETDEGAARLGEVALVPNSSPIAQSGVLFLNTLYDENSASHLAVGKAYRVTLDRGAEMSDAEFTAAGGNLSVIHTDFMIGSPELDIDGVLRDGRKEPVMRAGNGRLMCKAEG